MLSSTDPFCTVSPRVLGPAVTFRVSANVQNVTPADVANTAGKVLSTQLHMYTHMQASCQENRQPPWYPGTGGETMKQKWVSLHDWVEALQLQVAEASAVGVGEGSKEEREEGRVGVGRGNRCWCRWFGRGGAGGTGRHVS